MSKHLRAIATTMLLVAMLVTPGMQAMAAEQVSDTNNITVSDETVETTENVGDEVQMASDYFQDFTYSGTLSQGKSLGTVSLSQSARQVKWNIGKTGGSGVVVFSLTNQVTGEVRSVTATADNKLDSLTWVGALPKGNYNVKITFVSKSGIEGLNLYFYH